MCIRDRYKPDQRRGQRSEIQTFADTRSARCAAFARRPASGVDVYKRQGLGGDELPDGILSFGVVSFQKLLLGGWTWYEERVVADIISDSAT